MPYVERESCMEVRPSIPNRIRARQVLPRGPRKRRRFAASSLSLGFLPIRPMHSLAQWITRSPIGTTVRRWRRASVIIREMVDLERRGKKIPARLAGGALLEE